MAARLPPPAVFAAATVVFAAAWIGVFLLLGHFGFNNQATPQYGFTSGVGPMLLTALGMSTLITGLWHTHNCHEPRCWWIGRHKVNGTPYCNRHHQSAREEQTTDELLRALIDRLDQVLERL